ncbi:TPM domain-containing protein [Panacibacter ginsenosidivorans]|uniref:TPM domain-containing protein n=1 Tax=Panacibacter ginsenosidivorans TaxID=1813871 RepID=A0A5B8VIU6_9BACT|nr:TPM domain-containing protein [Panacibacter ginsenosidivorans]
MVIGISSNYRRIRIEIGYGLENILSDSETKQTIDNDFIPLFKQGEYYGGTLNGLPALIRKLYENSR